jgi:uncharacterized protein
LELILLLEADILDETGALGILWDAMVAGSRSVQSYTEVYRQLTKHSINHLNINMMRTEKAKEIWERKQYLAKEFIKQLEDDVAINDLVIDTNQPK